MFMENVVQVIHGQGQDHLKIIVYHSCFHGHVYR